MLLYVGIVILIVLLFIFLYYFISKDKQQTIQVVAFHEFMGSQYSDDTESEEKSFVDKINDFFDDVDQPADGIDDDGGDDGGE